jgi:hypothetical protein
MADSVISDRDVTIKYLLGNLPDAERLRIEEAFFARDEAFEAMLAAEDELFVDYARDALSPDQRTAFETRFLAMPEGRRKLAFATALMEALARQATAAPPITAGGFISSWDRRWLQAALIAAVVVLAAATGWLARDVARSRSAAASANAALAQEQAQRAQLQHDLSAARTAPAPLVVSLLLSPGLTRGSGETGRITLAAGADVVRLQLQAPKVAPGTYVARLRTAEGAVIWSARVSRGAADDLVTADVPARLLSTQDYELDLRDTAGAPAASYSLSVIRR